MKFTVVTVTVAAWAVATLQVGGADASNSETARAVEKRSAGGPGFGLLGELLLALLSGSGYGSRWLKSSVPVRVPVPTAGSVVPVFRDVHVVNRHVRPVSVPYPVPVYRDVAVPVPRPAPYAVDSPYPVPVPAPYAVPVGRPVPFAVDRPVPHAVPVPVPVVAVRDVPFPVARPYAFPVVKRVPVPDYGPGNRVSTDSLKAWR